MIIPTLYLDNSSHLDAFALREWRDKCRSDLDFIVLWSYGRWQLK